MDRQEHIFELPLGLSMALAKDPDANRRFMSMSREQQQQIIEQTHQVQSKQEMQQLVHSLVENQGLIY